MEQQIQYNEKDNSTLLVTKLDDGSLLCEPISSEQAALLSAKINGY